MANANNEIIPIVEDDQGEGFKEVFSQLHNIEDMYQELNPLKNFIKKEYDKKDKETIKKEMQERLNKLCKKVY